jgi:hypothetical protein
VHQSKTYLFTKTQPLSAILGFIVIRDGAELANTTLVEVAFKPNRTLLIHDPEYIRMSFRISMCNDSFPSLG